MQAHEEAGTSARQSGRNEDATGRRTSAASGPAAADDVSGRRAAPPEPACGPSHKAVERLTEPAAATAVSGRASKRPREPRLLLVRGGKRNGRREARADGADGGSAHPRSERVTISSLEDPGAARLFTAFVTDRRDGRWLQAFSAIVTTSPSVVRGTLAERYGYEAAVAADVSEGFDPSLPLVEGLVAPALSDMLVQVAAAPASALAAGLDVRIEQRFLS